MRQYFNVACRARYVPDAKRAGRCLASDMFAEYSALSARKAVAEVLKHPDHLLMAVDYELLPFFWSGFVAEWAKEQREFRARNLLLRRSL